MIQVVFTFISVLVLQQATAQTKAEKIDRLISTLHNDGAFNGNVLVAEKGKIVYEHSFGVANVKTGEKLTKASVFELASVTKQFTAMGIVLLEKQHKLSYDDPISKYLPELAAYKGITIKDLLVHTSGLPDYMELLQNTEDKNDFATNATILKAFQKQQPKVLFDPGEKWEYSNTGYVFLASIIEKVSKKTYGDYLKAAIFDPLGMQHTQVYRRRFQPEKISNLTEGHVYSDSLKRLIFPDDLGKRHYVVYLDGVVGDGMVHTTASDLLVWDTALYTDKLVNAKDKEQIFNSYTTKEGPTEYGFGWSISNDPVYGKLASHSGGWGGYITYIGRYLDQGYTIILLQNQSTKATVIPSRQIRNILYGTDVKVDLPLLEKMAGKYKTSKGSEKVVLLESGKLYIQMNPEVKLELIPVSGYKFIVDGFAPDVFFEFIMENGKVAKYINTQPEQQVTIEAIKI